MFCTNTLFEHIEVGTQLLLCLYLPCFRRNVLCTIRRIFSVLYARSWRSTYLRFKRATVAMNMDYLLHSTLFFKDMLFFILLIALVLLFFGVFLSCLEIIRRLKNKDYAGVEFFYPYSLHSIS